MSEQAQVTPDAKTDSNPVADKLFNADGVKKQDAPPAKEPPVSAGSKKEDDPQKDETPKPVVPEKYDLKPPKESKLSEKDVEAVAAYARERGFSQEQAQAQLERESGLVSDFEKKQMDQFQNLTQEWKSQSEKDPEIGGEKLKGSAELASRVIKRYGTPQFQQYVEKSGFGNHPELVRIFARIGKAMAEDQLVLPGSTDSRKKSVEEVFYGEGAK